MERNVGVESGLSPGAIHEMKAGIEMDRVIAKLVTGWCCLWKSPNTFGWWGHPPELQDHYHLEHDRVPVPYYSTEIERAWWLVEKLDLFRHYHLGQYLSGDTRIWSVEKHEATGYEGRCIPTHRVFASGDTAPLAICRAALLWTIGAR